MTDVSATDVIATDVFTPDVLAKVRVVDTHTSEMMSDALKRPLPLPAPPGPREGTSVASPSSLPRPSVPLPVPTCRPSHLLPGSLVPPTSHRGLWSLLEPAWPLRPVQL